jgi:hypothetical protein
LPSHGKGRRFEPCTAHQEIKYLVNPLIPRVSEYEKNTKNRPVKAGRFFYVFSRGLRSLRAIAASEASGLTRAARKSLG